MPINSDMKNENDKTIEEVLEVPDVPHTEFIVKSPTDGSDDHIFAHIYDEKMTINQTGTKSNIIVLDLHDMEKLRNLLNVIEKIGPRNANWKNIGEEAEKF